MSAQTIEINIKEQSFKDEEFALNELQNHIYRISAVYFEQIGEHQGFLIGNGHHAAQNVSKFAKEEWEKRTKKSWA